MSLLDEQILGPEHAFRSRYPVDPEVRRPARRTPSPSSRSGWRPVVQRTLRRQVREYVRYTNRRSIVEDFAPSRRGAGPLREGQRVPAALRGRGHRAGQEDAAHARATASSSPPRRYAIAPTLRKLADSLRAAPRRGEARRAGARRSSSPRRPSSTPRRARSGPTSPRKPASAAHAARTRSWELRAVRRPAPTRIQVNAKGEALKRALDRTFTVARAHQWPEKAVVFTESRRTQEYLFELLSATATRGKISLLSGDAGTPEERARAGRGVPRPHADPPLHRGRRRGPQPPVLQPGRELRPALEPAAHRAAHRPLPPLRPAARRAGGQLPQPPERRGRAAVRAAREEAQPLRRRVRRLRRDPRRAGERRRLRAARARHLPVLPLARGDQRRASTRCARTWSSASTSA